jgi:hypothetical protein
VEVTGATVTVDKYAMAGGPFKPFFGLSGALP